VDRLQSAAQRQQLIRFLLSIDAATPPIAPNAPGDLKSISSVSFAGSAIAPDSDIAAFGELLAPGVIVASGDLSTVLGGSSVSVRDSAGVLRLAPLFFVSPGQINYLLPASTAVGKATISVATSSGATAAGSAQVAKVAPALFSANGTGVGVSLAAGIRVKADGSQLPVDVFRCGAAAGSCVPAPIDFAGDQIYLVVYASGLRNRTSLENVHCEVGGLNAPVLFAGAQPTYAGFDQMNIQLPAGLRGRGEVNIVLTVDDVAANPVTINVQ
jgi:uncharacterized protein (TIGR03437 family)